MTEQLWWWRPLRAVLIGLLAGGALAFGLDQLPTRVAAWAIGLLVGVFLVWSLVELRNLNRAKRNLDEALERLYDAERDL